MITANRTPDLLAELIEASTTTSYHLGQMNSIHNSIKMARELNGYPATREDSDLAWQAAEAYLGFINEELPKSKIFFADEHMCEVIEMAAAVMDSSDIADISVTDVDSGFFYLAGGIPLGEHMIIHGLAWVKARDMVFITTYNDSFVKIDEMSKSWRSHVKEHTDRDITGRWSYGTLSMYKNGEQFAFVPELSAEEISERGYKYYEDVEQENDITINQIFHALMLLLNQPPQVIELTEEELTHKKQLKRVKASNLSTMTTVIDMRHRYVSKSTRAKEDGEEKSFEYSRRWLVSGHWRWQPMKDSETKEWIKKRIWINPHTKGPEDKPFIATKKVFALLK